MNMIKKLLKQREAAIVLIVLGLSIIMTIASSVFLTYQNIVALLLGMSIEVIIAVGMANLMASGGFDMSVGSIFRSLCGAGAQSRNAANCGGCGRNSNRRAGRTV